jgi:hypothetical protein
MKKFTIHEVYEYKVEADTAEQAQEIFENYMGNNENYEHLRVVYGGVTFTQNYLHILDQEGNEV